MVKTMPLTSLVQRKPCTASGITVITPGPRSAWAWPSIRISTSPFSNQNTCSSDSWRCGLISHECRLLRSAMDSECMTSAGGRPASSP